MTQWCSFSVIFITVFLILETWHDVFAYVVEPERDFSAY